jgi:hypothetical protein
MSNLSFLNVLDLARAFGEEPLAATPESIAVWLLDEYSRRNGGGFNYNPAIEILPDLFRGAMAYEAAIRHCEAKDNPKGRRQNVEAIKTIASYVLENQSTCYRIGLSAVAVGRIKEHTVYVGVKAPLVRVKGLDVFVVMPGFRRSHRPSERQIDLACSIALANFARDDFSGADFEYLYAGPGPSGDRQFRAILGREREIFSPGEIDILLDVYVRGVALALEGGAEVRRPNLRGYRVIDPREPSIFG